MERKKDSPQKAALREMMGNYLKENNVNDVNSIMRDMMSIILKGAFDPEIFPFVKKWQGRPLEEIYAVVFMDTIHYHVAMKTGL